MQKNLKRFFAVLMIVVLFSSVPGTTLAKGEDQKQLQKEREQVGKVGILESLFGLESGQHYHLDLAEEEEEEEGGFWKNLIPGWSFVEGTMDTVMTAIYVVINWANNFILLFNMMMTYFMMGILNFAYEFDFVNRVITHLDVMVKNITGISGETFTRGKGLFDGFLGIVVMISVGYAAFMYLWKRSSLESLGTLLQTVIALSLSLLLFSNYSTFLTNANKLTTEASGLFLSGSADKMTDGDQTNANVRKEMNKNIHQMFIHRPYLIMQYGTDNEEAIGKERINKLLKTKPGEKRNKIVNDEVRKKGNQMMTSASVTDRFVFSFFYTGMNGLNSIPIYLMSFLLIVLQFWFLGIAMVAPFAFLFAAIPGQFGVLRKYMAELFLPLGLKLLVSVGAIFVFFISSMLYNVRSFGSVHDYLAIGFVQFGVLMLIFLLRKRVFNIFSTGSKEMAMLRAEMALLRESMLSPVKSGVQATATVAGAAIGAAATGGTGTMAGAAIGGKVGKAVTGEMGPSDVASESARQLQLYKLKMPDSSEKTEGLEQENLRHMPTEEDLASEENAASLEASAPPETETDAPNLVSLKDVMSPEQYRDVMPSSMVDPEEISSENERAMDIESDMASLEENMPAESPLHQLADFESLNTGEVQGEKDAVQDDRPKLARLDQGVENKRGEDSRK